MQYSAASAPADIFDPAHYTDIHQPLEKAATLPPWCYVDEAFYRAEVEHIFMKVWNFLGRVDSIPNAGDYFTVNYVGVPLIIARGRDGEVRAFANTCRHRGSKVALADKGNCRAFICPYHGWVYNLDGTLRGANGMEKALDFDKGDYGLTRIRLETWGGFIFVNFDAGAESLMDYLGDMPEQFASYDCENLVTTRTVEFILPCNWKFFIENAMEEYHLPFVHKSTLNLKDFIHDIIPTEGNWDAIREKHEGTRALLEEDAGKGFPHIATLEGPPAEGTHYAVLYPSTMLGMTTDCLWWLEEHPQGPNEMKLIVGSCFPKETVARPDFDEKVENYYKRWDRAISEDNDVSGLQHEGVASPFATAGRLSHHEPLVHHIAKWVVDRVIGNRPGG